MGGESAATTSRIAVYAAAAACVAWAAKALAIWSAGGLDESALEGPLFLLGLLFVVAAFVALGLSLVASRGLVWRVLGVLLGAAAGLAFVVVVESLVGAAVPESAGWVKEEAGLWVAAVLALAVTLLRLRRLRPA